MWHVWVLLRICICRSEIQVERERIVNEWMASMHASMSTGRTVDIGDVAVQT